MATFSNELSEAEHRAYDASAANRQQSETLGALTPQVESLNNQLETMADRTDDATAAAERQGKVLAATTPKVSDLDAGIAAFTKRVLDAAAARKFEDEVIAGLPPEILELAYSLGILRREVKKTDREIRTEELAGMSNNERILSILDARIARIRNMDNPTEANVDALRALIAKRDEIRGLQHGGIVLPRMGGTMVNVGEAGRAEAVIPLPDLASLAGNLMAGVGGGMGFGGGMSGSGGGGREVVLALDGERLGSVFLDQFNILQSENRLLVDLV